MTERTSPPRRLRQRARVEEKQLEHTRYQVAREGLVTVNCNEHGRGQLKCDGTRAETIFRLSAKRTSPFKSAGGHQFSRLLAAELCASAVVMLDTSCSEVV